MITMTAQRTRTIHRRILAVAAVGAFALALGAWALHDPATPAALATAMGDAARSALTHGCARLSCVLDAGAGQVFAAGKAVATVLALLRSALAIL